MTRYHNGVFALAYHMSLHSFARHYWIHLMLVFLTLRYPWIHWDMEENKRCISKHDNSKFCKTHQTMSDGNRRSRRLNSQLASIDVN